MALLNKAQITSAPLKFKDVEIPEWGGSVRVQEHSVKLRFAYANAVVQIGGQWKDYEADQALPEDERKGVAKPKKVADDTLRLIYSIVDDEGQPLFTVDDLDTIQGLSYVSLNSLYVAFLELNTQGVTVEAVDAKKKPSKRSPRGKSSSI